MTIFLVARVNGRGDSISALDVTLNRDQADESVRNLLQSERAAIVERLQLSVNCINFCRYAGAQEHVNVAAEWMRESFAVFAVDVLAPFGNDDPLSTFPVIP